MRDIFGYLYIPGKLSGVCMWAIVLSAFSCVPIINHQVVSVRRPEYTLWPGTPQRFPTHDPVKDPVVNKDQRLIIWRVLIRKIKSEIPAIQRRTAIFVAKYEVPRSINGKVIGEIVNKSIQPCIAVVITKLLVLTVCNSVILALGSIPSRLGVLTIPPMSERQKSDKLEVIGVI